MVTVVVRNESVIGLFDNQESRTSTGDYSSKTFEEVASALSVHVKRKGLAYYCGAFRVDPKRVIGKTRMFSVQPEPATADIWSEV